MNDACWLHQGTDHIFHMTSQHASNSMFKRILIIRNRTHFCVLSYAGTTIFRDDVPNVHTVQEMDIALSFCFLLHLLDRVFHETEIRPPSPGTTTPLFAGPVWSARKYMHTPSSPSFSLIFLPSVCFHDALLFVPHAAHISDRVT